MPGPFRLRPGPAGDLSTYASATTPGRAGARPRRALSRPAAAQGRGGRRRPDLSGPGRPPDPRVGLARRHRRRCAAPASRPATSPRWAGSTTWPSWPSGDPRDRAPPGGGLRLRRRAGAAPGRRRRAGGRGGLPRHARPTSAPLAADPERLLARCRQTGVSRSPGFPASVEAWAKELSVLHPAEDAALLKGRPLLVVHGSDDPDVPAGRRPGPGRRGHRALRAARRAAAPATGSGPTPGSSPSWWAGWSGATDGGLTPQGLRSR